MAESLELPVIDLSSSNRISTANSIRQACMDHGFFYLINHGVEEKLLQNVFDESRNFFSLPLEEKMKLARKEDVGFAPIYAQKLDYSAISKGDSKETFRINPIRAEQSGVNQWPSAEILPSWKLVMEDYYKKVASVGKRLISLIAFALDLEDDYFEKIGAVTDKPFGVLHLLHYPGEKGVSDEVVYGASAHSDYGMITLLATDGVPGLQVCREKHKQPRIWENVSHLNGAFIVNLGDMMERWTNCVFRSTLHRVMPTGKERYSVAFFFNASPDCIVECLKSCCNESSPPKFPPIRSAEYLRERLDAAYIL